MNHLSNTMNRLKISASEFYHNPIRAIVTFGTCFISVSYDLIDFINPITSEFEGEEC